jgi:hypothetical protein
MTDFIQVSTTTETEQAAQDIAVPIVEGSASYLAWLGEQI